MQQHSGYDEIATMSGRLYQLKLAGSRSDGWLHDVDCIALQSTLVPRKLSPRMRKRLCPMKSFLDLFTVQIRFFHYPVRYGYAENAYTMDCILYSNGRRRFWAATPANYWDRSGAIFESIISIFQWIHRNYDKSSAWRPTIWTQFEHWTM